MCVVCVEHRSLCVHVILYRCVVTSSTGAVAKYCDEYVFVCVCVCLCLRKDISGTTRAIFTKFFMHIANGCGSILLRRCGDIRYVLPVLWMTSYFFL